MEAEEAVEEEVEEQVEEDVMAVVGVTTEDTKMNIKQFAINLLMGGGFRLPIFILGYRPAEANLAAATTTAAATATWLIDVMATQNHFVIT